MNVNDSIIPTVASSYVYNGTVERHHNYFIVDEKTHLMINQLNCGETYINK